MANVTAVVLTYNRAQLLLECVAAVLNQSLPVATLLIIDNCSTDGTRETLSQNGYLSSQNVNYFRTKTNLGASGGFAFGMFKATQFPAEWVWVMDDDVIPEADSLQKLLDATKITGDNSFLCSTAFDATKTHPINVPHIKMTKDFQGYPAWGKYLHSGIVSIASCTFVSILIPRKAIQEAGLPFKDFYIWGDDTEYTRRLVKHGYPGYQVGTSIVRHLRQGNGGIDLAKEQSLARIDLYKYFFRNHIYLARQSSSPKEMIKFIVSAISTLFKIRKESHRKRKIVSLIKGLMLGFVFSPATTKPEDFEESLDM